MGNAFLYGAGGGGKTKNVVCIRNGESGAVITATLGTKTKIAETDASGYAFFTNLDAGTWTLQATKTGRYVGPKTLEISSTQTVYYIKYPFRTYVYDGSLHSAGEHGANVCEDISGGWTIGGNDPTYGEDKMTVTQTGGYNCTFRNKTAIDLTPFNTFYITCKSGYTDTKVGIAKSYSSYTSFRVYVQTTSSSSKTYSMDVSEFDNLTGIVSMTQQNGNMSLSAAWFE